MRSTGGAAVCSQVFLNLCLSLARRAVKLEVWLFGEMIYISDVGIVSMFIEIEITERISPFYFISY